MADPLPPDRRTVVGCAVTGWFAIGLLVAAIVVIFGGSAFTALAAGLFVGLVVGGGLGFLASGRAGALGADD